MEQDNWTNQKQFYEGYLSVFIDYKHNKHIRPVTTEKDKKYQTETLQQMTMFAAGVYSSDGIRKFEFRQIPELIKWPVYRVEKVEDAIKIAWCVGLDNFLILRQQEPIKEGVFDFERILAEGEELEKKQPLEEQEPYAFLVIDFAFTSAEEIKAKAEIYNALKHADLVIEEQKNNKLYMLGRLTAKGHVRDVKRAEEEKEARRQARKQTALNYANTSAVGVGYVSSTLPKKVGLLYEKFPHSEELFDLY